MTGSENNTGPPVWDPGPAAGPPSETGPHWMIWILWTLFYFALAD